MYLLLNRDELASHLTRMLLIKQLRNRIPVIRISEKAIKKCQKRAFKKDESLTPETFHSAVSTQVQKWKSKIDEQYKLRYKKTLKWVNERIDTLPQEFLINIAKTNQMPSFVKTVGQQIDAAPKFITPLQVDTVMDPILIRNIIHNETLIKDKLTAHKDFWFIDTGYTNFLESSKHWHRLIRGSLHHQGSNQSFPTDRLNRLPSCPVPWRQDGNAILVVESSRYHYQLHGLSLDDWKDWVVAELRQHTDRPIEFRPKLDKKQRDNLYTKLTESDYYCVVHHSSAAAIEAIWAGIPVITLGQHITSSVARTQLLDINNLYRGDINNWLCQLTYSQYTKEELFDGTALRLMREVGYV